LTCGILTPIDSHGGVSKRCLSHAGSRLARWPYTDANDWRAMSGNLELAGGRCNGVPWAGGWTASNFIHLLMVACSAVTVLKLKPIDENSEPHSSSCMLFYLMFQFKGSSRLCVHSDAWQVAEAASTSRMNDHFSVVLHYLCPEAANAWTNLFVEPCKCVTTKISSLVLIAMDAVQLGQFPLCIVKGNQCTDVFNLGRIS